MYQKQRKHLVHIQGITFFQCLHGPNNIPYTEEKQPYLDVQIVQTNKLGESGDMFLQEIFENQTQSESDLMQNSIVLFVYMICSLSCPIN